MSSRPVQHHPVAGLEPASVGSPQCPHRLGVPPEGRLPDVRQVVPGRRAEDEAVAGRLGSRLDHLAPGEQAEPRLGQVQRRQRPGDGDRPEPDGHRHPAAVRRADVLLVDGHARGAAEPRHRDVAVDRDGYVAAGRPDGDVRATGQRDDPGLGDHRDERGRDRGVDGPAPVVGHPAPGVGGQGVGRRHRHPRHTRHCAEDAEGGVRTRRRDPAVGGAGGAGGQAIAATSASVGTSCLRALMNTNATTSAAASSMAPQKNDTW